jgi:uncharacterized membrane protein
MRNHLALVLEVIGVCLLGIMAGFFFAFAVDVAPAMENLDAAAYVTAQQWINRVVRNITFGVVYFGSTVFPFLAAGAVFWSGSRARAIAWLAIAVAYFLAVFWVTRTVNVPINNELASWQSSAPPSNWQHARDAWNQSNLVRTVAAVGCFVAATWLVATRRARSRVV